MAKSRSRKRNSEREKWLRQQRILGVIQFILCIYLCTIDMDFTPAIISFLIMVATFLPEK